MKLTISVGDVASDIVAGVKESEQYKLIFHSDWYWGHSVLVNNESVKWNANTVFNFSVKPQINVANLGDRNHDIEIEFLRID
tara:strand:+ start:323 stop:568 length:246 start_codon:yes stop_codon:yes gene_type:complete